MKLQQLFRALPPRLAKYCLVLPALLLLASCKKDPASEEFIEKFWNVDLNTRNVVPGLPGRTGHAACLLYLTDNRDLYYDVYFDTLDAAETIGEIALFTGAPSANGTPLVTLGAGVSSANKTKGKVRLDTTQINALNRQPVYLSIASKSAPAGFVRGQLGKKIIYAADVNLSGAGVTPPVTTPASGSVFLRVTEDNVLHYYLQVTGLPADDQLTAAHIHKGTDLSLVLATVDTAYNKPMTTQITAAYLTSLQSDALQVDVHSQNFVNGLLNGILR
ncbi:CHRD domain-containing protein [uncultured Chitinophaga sp.]|uniref:CHRD domain-containing protein n=1 Tax=uncultured Chitinophaga sp. TaxID=339340 RepID=UPI0025E972A0|nr:CHRD domain-containing protein [uncultured Chitinophaga sp.]